MAQLPWKQAGEGGPQAACLFGARSAFTIERWPLGFIVRGGAHGIPLTALEALDPLMVDAYGNGKKGKDRAVMDAGLASAFNAILVIGLPEELQEWRLEVDALLPVETVHDWLASYDVGQSSKVIAHAIAGGSPPDPNALPRDADDFGRCYRLVKQFGYATNGGLELVVHKRPNWRRLVDAWPDLCRLYEDRGKPGGREAFQTALQAVT